jgi:ribosomal protein S27E
MIIKAMKKITLETKVTLYQNTILSDYSDEIYFDEKVELPETEIRCDTCHSLLAYNQKDIKNISKMCYSDLVNVKVVKCPVCGEYITIDIF